MEKSLELVNIGTLHEIWWTEADPVPLWHSELLVTEHSVVRLFVDGHVHAEGSWVEIEHDGLLPEAESTQGSSDHLVNIVVEGLLKVDRGRLNQHGVPSYPLKGHDSLLKL